MEQTIRFLMETFGLSDAQSRILAQEELLPMLQIIRQKWEQNQKELSVLHAERSFFLSAIDALPNPVFLKDDQLRFVFFNQKYQEFFNLKEGEYLGKRVTDLEYLAEEDREKYQQEDSALLKSQSVLQYEAGFHTADQGITETLYWSRGFTARETGARGIIGEIVDISKEKKLQRELTRHTAALELLMEETKRTSRRDPVTKLYNRLALTEDIPAILERTKAEHRPLCGLITDIDAFKSINDTYGHMVGDEILNQFASVLTGSFRQGDLAIRYGGDEFVVMLFDMALPVAKTVAERFRSRVREEVRLPDGKQVTISVGLTEFRHDEDFMQFLSRADEALYLAKNSGKNRVESL